MEFTKDATYLYKHHPVTYMYPSSTSVHLHIIRMPITYVKEHAAPLLNQMNLVSVVRQHAYFRVRTQSLTPMKTTNQRSSHLLRKE